MNFHMKDGIYFRCVDDKLVIVRAKDFDDAGETIASMSVSEFSSVVSSFSPHQEQHGSFNYVYEFLTKGTMFCGGCGKRLTPENACGWLSVVNLSACMSCYEEKFKPLFDWGMKHCNTKQ